MLSLARRFLPWTLGILMALPNGPALAAPQAGSDQVTRERSTGEEKLRDSLSGSALTAFDRGMALARRGDMVAARASFVEAHAASHDPRILYNVAVCDKEQGRPARAITVLQQSLRELPNGAFPAYRKRAEATIKTLQTLTGELHLVTEPKEAEVLLDAQPLQRSLDGVATVERGPHTLEVRAQGFISVRQTVDISAGPTVLRVTLQRQPPPRLVLSVSGLPRGTTAVVKIDGRPVGTAPWSGDVSAGSHTVRVEAPGHAPLERRITALEGSEQKLDVTLEQHRPTARLRLSTGHADAAIWIDGRLMGRGSFDGLLVTGVHEAIVRKSGYEPARRTLELRPDEVRSIDLDLSRSGISPWWFVLGGVALTAGAITTAAILADQSVTFRGAQLGTLSPPSGGIVPASWNGGDMSSTAP